MNQRMRLNTEDRWVLLSMGITLGGIILGAILAQPRAFGITALLVLGLLLIAWRWTHSPRLAWLLLFGLMAGVLELWADWVHVVYFHSLVLQRNVTYGRELRQLGLAMGEIGSVISSLVVANQL
jgi:hypothetical protein